MAAAAVLADFNYLDPFPQPVKQPIPFNIGLNLGKERPNIKRLPVQDIRSVDAEAKGLTIEKAGFQFIKHRSNFIDRVRREGKDFADHDSVTTEEWENEYAGEIKDILQNLFPNQKLRAFHRFGHVIRVSTPETSLENAYNRKKAAGIAPRVHIDVSRFGAHSWLSTFGPDAVTEATQPGRRLVWFSIWRPLKTVQRDPLGVVDSRSVDPTELCRMQRPFDHLKVMGEAIICGPRPGRILGHRWYWMSDQTPEDVIVFKLYDSKDDAWEQNPEGARVLAVPHSSFELEGSEDMPMRESVEYRVAVVVDEE